MARPFLHLPIASSILDPCTLLCIVFTSILHILLYVRFHAELGPTTGPPLYLKISFLMTYIWGAYRQLQWLEKYCGCWPVLGGSSSTENLAQLAHF
jgi:hypothetical protein